MDDERGKPLDFIEAHGDHIYLFMDVREQLSKFIINVDAHQITEVATVMSIGGDVKSFKIGDRVLIGYSKGIHIQIPESYTTSKYHRIIREHEILTKISQEKRDTFNKE